MRKLAAGGALAALLIAIVPTLSSGAASRPCAMKASRLLLANSVAHVYVRTGRDRTVTYACLDPQRRRQVLAEGDTGGEGANTHATSIVLERRFVAWQQTVAQKGNLISGPRVIVNDLGTGRTISVDVKGGELLSDLALTPTGTVAWIQRTNGERRVMAHDGNEVRQLDAGSGIDPFSLAVADAGPSSGQEPRPVLYWRRDGAPRMAELP